MLRKLYDGLLALIFIGISAFGASTLYNIVKEAAIIQVSRGLSSTYLFSQKLTEEDFSWED